MVRQYFAKHADGSVTSSNWPIKETGAVSYEFETKKTDVKAVQEGEAEWVILDGVLSTKDLKSKKDAAKADALAVAEAIKGRKKELIKKITEGKATAEEQEEFANLI